MQDSEIFPLKQFDGGIADRKNAGVKGSFAFGFGINLRDALSTLTPNQVLKKDSSTTVDELINFFIPSTDGNLYGFGQSGGIYKRTSGGAWSKIYTDLDGAIRGAMEIEYNDGAGNYIPHMVWATQTKLKSEELTGMASPSPTTELTFHRGEAGDWHTMIPALGVGVICDGDYLALIDYEGAVNTKALQLPYGTETRALLEQNNEVVIGTKERSGQRKGWLFTWDRIQDSWIQKRDAQARGVNAMNFFESGMLISAGSDGALNYWDTVNYFPLKNIPGGGTVQPGGIGEYKGASHFGVSGGDKNGIWSYARTDKNTPYALNLEYLISPVATAGTVAQIETKMADSSVEIGAVTNYEGELFVAWKDGTDYGVDTIDPDNKATAVYESLVYNAKHPESEKIWRYAKVVADVLPAGTEVILQYKTNADADWQDTKTADGATSLAAGKRKAIFPMEGTGEEYQVRLEIMPNGNEAPNIRSINTLFRHLGVT
jgi:hypothetical protein